MTSPGQESARRGGRHAGLLAPLASCPSRTSWGIGEIPDLAWLGAWARSAGLDRIQILPVLEMATVECSPYSAISAMAIDPIYVRLTDVEDFEDGGGEASLDAGARETLAGVRAAPRVDFEAVRALKHQALGTAFEHFLERHWRSGSARARALAHFIEDQSWWLDDYALFRAIQTEHAGTAGRGASGTRDARSPTPWTEWPAPLRAREPEALRNARDAYATSALRHQYTQWIAATQWARMRARTPVAVVGDWPFMIVLDSADVWTRQDQFDVDVTIGTPPDAFSASGQDWRLPACRWEAMAADGFAWIAARARRYASLFDGYRIDHVVGLYRTYVRPADGRPPGFVPPDERQQRAQGERLIQLCLRSDVEVLAEDLGSIPDFVRASLARLGIPGYRVLRWESDPSDPDGSLLAPAAYPPRSVATTGTHDTTTLAGWWDEMDEAARARLLRLPGLEATGVTPEAAFDPALRDACLRALLAAGSDLVILPIQDIFGWTDRINAPGTISSANWTFRLPWPVDAMARHDTCVERAAALAAWNADAGRQ